MPPGQRKRTSIRRVGPAGQRWHLPALPTTLAKLESISATTLTRLVPRTQQRCKEVSTATQSGKSQGEAPPHRVHTAPVPTAWWNQPPV
ncbi:MAG: hypothetical protein ACXWPS_14760 [Ktedonobacteraceae bacterium]